MRGKAKCHTIINDRVSPHLKIGVGVILIGPLSL
jgi:hypothetical protein